MHTIGSIARTEARQLWRSRSFWIVHAILILPPAAQTVFALLSRITAQGENLQVLSTNSFLGRTSLSFYLLLIPVLISPIITRNLGKPGEILWSTPLDPIKHLAGTYCGIWSGLLPGIFIQIAGWWVADLFAPQFFTDWVWFYSLFLFLVVLTISVGLTMALALLLRRSLPVLIAWIVLWVLLNLEITEGLEESFIAARAPNSSRVLLYSIRLCHILS